MERPPLSMDELVDHWTVLSDEAGLVNAKQESTRLAFALLLKFYTQHGRFPRGRAEFPDEVVDYVARQTRTPASTLGLYEWSGRTIERHRREIRDHLGFRECSVPDADKLTDWLASTSPTPSASRSECARNCSSAAGPNRSSHPPGQITRMVRSALHSAEQTWFARIATRLGAETSARILALVAADQAPEAEEEDTDNDLDEDQGSVLSLIKAMPGNVSLDSMPPRSASPPTSGPSACPPTYSPTWRRRCWPGGGSGPRWNRRHTCVRGRATRRKPPSPCWRRCWSSGNARSPTPWSTY